MEEKEKPVKKSYKKQSYKKVCLFCQEKVEAIDYKDSMIGLHQSITNFLDKDLPFQSIDWKFEALQDYLLGQRTPQEEIPIPDRKIYEAYRNINVVGLGRIERNLEPVKYTL